MMKWSPLDKDWYTPSCTGGYVTLCCTVHAVCSSGPPPGEDRVGEIPGTEGDESEVRALQGGGREDPDPVQPKVSSSLCLK